MVELMTRNGNSQMVLPSPRDTVEPREDVGRAVLSRQDLYLFNEGSHYRLYHKLGAHPVVRDGVAGTHFAVWAPSAGEVYVMGDFNHWNKTGFRLYPKEQSGI